MMRKLLEAMTKFAGQPEQKPGEQWKGTDKGTPGNKLVGSADESVLKDLSKGVTPKTKEQELAEEWANFNEDDLGVEEKRPHRTGSRADKVGVRGHKEQPRYTTVKDEVDEATAAGLKVGDHVTANTSKGEYPGGHKSRAGKVTRVGQTGVHITPDDGGEVEYHPYKIVKKTVKDKDVYETTEAEYDRNEMFRKHDSETDDLGVVGMGGEFSAIAKAKKAKLAKQKELGEGWNNGTDRVQLADSTSAYWDGSGRLQAEYDELYGQLVPASGAAETLEGEVLRAASKIVYRHFNDGDLFNKASFDQLKGYIGSVTSYDDLAEKAVEYALRADGNYHPNASWDSLDVMDYGPAEEDEEYDDDEDDYGWDQDEEVDEGVADVYSITSERNGRERSKSGTLAELIEYYGYTLETGKSYEHERGNRKINLNPKSIESLVQNLNNAKSNAAANGRSNERFYVDHGNMVEGRGDSKGLHKKVTIVKGRDAGKTGYVRQIKTDKLRNRVYLDLDLEDGGQAVVLKQDVRLVKDLAKNYTGRETKDGVWRVFKDGQGGSVAGPFKSAEEANAWIKKQNQGVVEARTTWNNDFYVYDPKTKTVKKKFRTHRGAKQYAEANGLKVASAEYYHDTVSKEVNESDKEEFKSTYQKFNDKVKRQKEKGINWPKEVPTDASQEHNDEDEPHPYGHDVDEGWESGPEEHTRVERDPDTEYDARRQEKLDAEADKAQAQRPQTKVYTLSGRGPNNEPNYAFPGEYATQDEADAARAKLMADPNTPNPRDIGIRAQTKYMAESIESTDPLEGAVLSAVQELIQQGHTEVAPEVITNMVVAATSQPFLLKDLVDANNNSPAIQHYVDSINPTKVKFSSDILTVKNEDPAKDKAKAQAGVSSMASRAANRSRLGESAEISKQGFPDAFIGLVYHDAEIKHDTQPVPMTKKPTKNDLASNVIVVKGKDGNFYGARSNRREGYTIYGQVDGKVGKQYVSSIREVASWIKSGEYFAIPLNSTYYKSREAQLYTRGQDRQSSEYSAILTQMNNTFTPAIKKRIEEYIDYIYANLRKLSNKPGRYTFNNGSDQTNALQIAASLEQLVKAGFTKNTVDEYLRSLGKRDVGVGSHYTNIDRFLEQMKEPLAQAKFAKTILDQAKGLYNQVKDMLYAPTVDALTNEGVNEGTETPLRDKNDLKAKRAELLKQAEALGISESTAHKLLRNKFQQIGLQRKLGTPDSDAAYKQHVERMKKSGAEYVNNNPNTIYKKVDEFAAPGMAGPAATTAPVTNATKPVVDPATVAKASAATNTLKAATGTTVGTQTLDKALDSATQGTATSTDVKALAPMMGVLNKAAQDPKLASQFKTLANQAKLTP